MIVKASTRTYGPADHGRAVTDAEIRGAHWIEGYHYEIIDGRVYVSPLPDLSHDDLAEWLAESLRAYARAHPDVINVVKTRSRVFVPGRRRTTAPEPDVAAYRDFPYHTPRLQRRWQDVSPILVAEVVSGDVGKDLVRNVDLYERVPTIQEYWVVNQYLGMDDFFFRVYRRRGRKWQKPIAIGMGDTYTTRLLPGFALTINPDALRRMALSPRTPGVKLLHLLPSFDYSAAARQVGLLASGLRSLTLPARLDIHVAALGPDGPLAAPLQAAGVPVHVLGTDRRIDPGRWWRLRQLVAELRPDVVHAWRVPALRAAGGLHMLPRQSFRLVVSEPRRGGSHNAIDYWLLRGADAVVAAHPTEAASLRRLGVSAERVHVVPPAVAVPPSGEPPPLDLPLPPEAKVVMCIGSLTPAHGFYDAVWAADILKYAVPEVQLVIVGDGPDRDRLRQFMRRVHRAWGGEFVHLLPACPDAAALLPRADVVWVPSRADCGRQVLLEAMAAGRPVVASALPGLAALVRDGVTGLLTLKGDPPTLTRQTRELLDDPELARQLGEAARQAMIGNGPERIAAAHIELYARIVL